MPAYNYRPIPQLSWDQIERFHALVDKKGPEDCWLWRGATDRDGYGSVTINNLTYIATRVAVTLATGKDPGPMIVMHTCPIPNPTCCNPAHLQPGTDKENHAFRIRNPKVSGENSGQHKLTQLQVDESRERYAAGETQVSIAKRFGVSQPLMSKILRGELWPLSASPDIKTRVPTGDNHGRRTLDSEKVRQILKMSESGMTSPQIAAQFGVTPSLVRMIVKRRIWKDVKV